MSSLALSSVGYKGYFVCLKKLSMGPNLGRKVQRPHLWSSRLYLDRSKSDLRFRPLAKKETRDPYGNTLVKNKTVVLLSFFVGPWCCRTGFLIEISTSAYLTTFQNKTWIIV